jgi:hypothetical protein
MIKIRHCDQDRITRDKNNRFSFAKYQQSKRRNERNKLMHQWMLSYALYINLRMRETMKAQMEATTRHGGNTNKLIIKHKTLSIHKNHSTLCLAEKQMQIK